jgi:hypothetical protein
VVKRATGLTAAIKMGHLQHKFDVSDVGKMGTRLMFVYDLDSLFPNINHNEVTQELVEVTQNLAEGT